MYKVLLTDNIAQQALDVFAGHGEIEATSVGTLDPAELKTILPDYHAIIVRSPTKLTAEIIEAGTNLKFIGRAGVGVDNIDVGAATARGITVMNAPRGNIVSTAEHTIAMILALARWIPQADRSVREEKWDRKTFKGVELCGKTLGIIGLGRVGREVARRMLAFDMEILAADPYITEETAGEVGAHLVDMDNLLSNSDFITIHVPLGPETRGFVSEAQVAKMRDGVYVVNCSRGGVVDEDVLHSALESGKIAGLALDVYESEPPGRSPLFGHPRTVFTPHLGAATTDAQLRVAVDVSQSVARALLTGDVRDAVNKPSTQGS